jgi:hypothetical protein
VQREGGVAEPASTREDNVDGTSGNRLRSRLERKRSGVEPVVRGDALKHGDVVAADESGDFGVAVAAVWVVANEPP